MRRVKASVGVVAAVMGCLLVMPPSANAALVTIDEIIFQQDGSVNSSVFAGTANFTVSGNTLTIVLTNTSTGATGGAAATNLLTGIGFTLPAGVSILNDGATNHVAITAGSLAINFGAPISDTQWGADNSPTAMNNLTISGDVNAATATLQASIDFDLAGTAQPPANVDGPGFGLLSNSVSGATLGGGLEGVQNSVTLTLLLGGTVPGNLLTLIENGQVVLAFGSPTASAVPEPSTLLLVGTALVSLAAAPSMRNRLFRRAKGIPAAA